MSNAKKVWYVAGGLNCWGRGHTADEAVRQMRTAGFRGRARGNPKVKVFKCPSGAVEPYVNELGGLCWTWAKDADKSLGSEAVKY